MEPSLATLAFKGSIMEAIGEAKQLKKLFLVYISGDNAESNNLETLTWGDASVADAVSKFCVLLHILEGSSEAANFSAIYPQRSAPCITAVGYNGVPILQYDGFVAADVLASNIEKAWLSLHIQETTATFLTAALASKVPSTSGVNETADDRSSSNMNVFLPPTNRDNDSTDVRSLANNEEVEQNNRSEALVEEIDTHVGTEESSSEGAVFDEFDSHVDAEVHQGSSSVDKLESAAFNQDIPHAETAKPSLSFAGEYVKQTGGEAHTQNRNLGLLERCTEAEEVSKGTRNEANEAIQADGVEDLVVEKADVSESRVSTSSDVHLNVRLPDGSSLRVKFSVTDNLRMVKDHVDKNQTTSLGSYALAIPYPRRVFTEEDLDRTLLGLGLLSRQTLIVIVHRGATRDSKGDSALHDQNKPNRDGSPNAAGNEGHWPYIRRVLSYLNPFSYLGAPSNSTDSVQNPQNSVWQYSSNRSLENDPRSQGRLSRGPLASDRSGATTNSSTRNRRVSQQTSSGYGINVHTLKHDNDDHESSDRNTFWNGNSTQFGGGDAADGK